MRVKPVVVDSSVVVKFILSEREEWLDRADKLLRQVERDLVALAAPELVKYEVGNAILHKKLTEVEKLACLGNLYDLPIKYYPIGKREAGQVVEIASHSGITFYDASFLVLAKKLKAILVTANPKHQEKFKGVKVIPLEKY